MEKKKKQRKAYVKPVIETIGLQHDRMLLAGSPSAVPGNENVIVIPPTDDDDEELFGAKKMKGSNFWED